MNRIASVFILLLAGIFVLLSFFGSHGFRQLRAVNIEIADMRDRTARLSGEISEINNEIASFKNDDLALEKNAREELGLARADEVVYIFPNRGPKLKKSPTEVEQIGQSGRNNNDSKVSADSKVEVDLLSDKFVGSTAGGHGR